MPIQDFLKIPHDKLLHLTAGIIISAFSCITLGIEWCIIPAIFAGFFKEFYDEWQYGGFDWLDMLYTIGGGALIQIFAL